MSSEFSPPNEHPARSAAPAEIATVRVATRDGLARSNLLIPRPPRQEAVLLEPAARAHPDPPASPVPDLAPLRGPRRVTSTPVCRRRAAPSTMRGRRPA